MIIIRVRAHNKESMIELSFLGGGVIDPREEADHAPYGEHQLRDQQDLT